MKGRDIMAWYDPYMPSQTKGFEAVPRVELLLSPKEYLALTEEERANFKQVTIIPPRLGESGFGKFLLMPKNLIYKVVV